MSLLLLLSIFEYARICWFLNENMEPCCHRLLCITTTIANIHIWIRLDMFAPRWNPSAIVFLILFVLRLISQPFIYRDVGCRSCYILWKVTQIHWKLQKASKQRMVTFTVYAFFFFKLGWQTFMLSLLTSTFPLIVNSVVSIRLTVSKWKMLPIQLWRTMNILLTFFGFWVGKINCRISLAFCLSNHV